MSPAALTMDRNDAGKAAVNPWVIALALTLGLLMEVLDTSIANVALPHIAGSLSAETLPPLERGQPSVSGQAEWHGAIPSGKGNSPTDAMHRAYAVMQNNLFAQSDPLA
jgi:hypothetical protein